MRRDLLGRLTGVRHAGEQPGANRPVFLYDGDCAFCTSCARFIERHIPAAIARMLVDAGSYWRPLGWLLDRRPVRWIAGPAYRLIARNRHRLPGGTAACLLSQAERDRIDTR